MTSDEQRAASRNEAILPTQPTNGASDPDRLDQLDRYWDATTGNGYQRADAIALDPAHARTIDQLQTLAHARSAGIPEEGRARIWRDAVTQAGIPTRQESPVTSQSSPSGALAASGLTLPASHAPNGRLPSHPVGGYAMPGGRRPSQPTGRAWWPRLQFAVAAVLILGLFATILAPMDDGPVGLFGGIGNDATPTDEIGTNEFAGGGGSQTVPAFNEGLDLRLYQLTLSASASFDLPPGPAWHLQGLVGNAELTSGGEGGEPLLINSTRIGGTGNGGTLTNLVESESLFWVSGLVPRETNLANGSEGVIFTELGRQDVSTLPAGSDVNLSGAYYPASVDPRPLVVASPPEAGPQPPPGSMTAAVVHAARGRVSIDDVPGSGEAMTLSAGESVSLEDIGQATVTGLSADQGDQSYPDTFYVVSVQPYVFGQGRVMTPESGAIEEIPSIGYPDAFTGGGSLVDLPASQTGHTISIDRVTLISGTTLTLPPGSVSMVASVTGLFTVERANGSSPLSIDQQPSSVDIDLGGGTILADQGEDATVTVLTIAPEGTAPRPPTDGVTVYPLTSYTTGAYRFETRINVLFGNGSAPGDPEPVGPSAIPDDPQNLAAPGTTMLLYAEQGSIRIASEFALIEDPDSRSESREPVDTLTIAPGETAIVGDPGLATIQQAAPGDGAVYTVAFLAPPALDRTVGRTYPNTAGGGGGLQPIPTDGSDYQIVLDRLTLEPGATATFAPGTIRAVQWTGGGPATMTSDDAGLPPVVFEERSLNGSFGDLGFGLAATGDAPVTLTLMSFLPAGVPGETVPTGQEGLTGERLSAHIATNPSNAAEFRVSFYATAAAAFPIEIDPSLDSGIGIDVADTYALIRAEEGAIVLDRPARRIVDGTETTEIAAGVAIPPGETVRVDDLRNATIQTADSDTPAGYTIVVVSPSFDPVGAGIDASTPPALTGLTPASIDVTAEVPATGPLGLDLVRHTIDPDGELSVSGPDGAPVTLVSYAAAGSATISADGQADIELAARSSDLAMGTITATGAITVRAGDAGITLYQVVIGGPVEATVVSGNATTEPLGTSTTDALGELAADGDATGAVRIMLRSEVGLGDGSSQNLGRDSVITLLTPLTGDAQITPGVGEVRTSVAEGAAGGTVITRPATVSPGGSVVALPDAAFRIAPAGDTVGYLWVEIEAVPEAATPAAPDGTLVAGTSGAGATPAADVPACDITPRTVDELLALYDEGIANPVDPAALSHRDDLGTGTPADPETIAAITDTLLRQSACTNLDDPLRQYALDSDEALRYGLPLIYESRDQLASLLEQSPAQASEAAIGQVSISDVELFDDGRVGARVAFGSEFAYITFAQADDGTWLVDVFDDRDEPGA